VIKKRYLVVIRKHAHNYSATLPDVPNMLLTAETLEELCEAITDGFMVLFNLDHGDDRTGREETTIVPEPEADAMWIEVEFPDDTHFEKEKQDAEL